ncbi:MAG: HAMP domain-containing protein, partial [Bdellovibrionales bacterium]|nr:HAMP domain-containing protein [Bdellovibrionales bacterium]
MFSKNPDYPRKRISLQLSIWYTTIFLLTFVSLFAAAFVILHTTLKQRDHEFILDELSEYTSRYDKSGLESTITEIKFESGVPANKSFFVRIADPVNHTLFLSAPENWDGFDLLQLEKQLPKPNKKWMRLSKQDDEDVMEIAFARLKDGRMMEVGMSSGNRNEQLERFWRFSGLLFPIALIGILGGSFLSFRALRPIHHLITTVRSVVDTGNMEARVPTRQTGDEMDELSKLFNRMFDKVDVLIKSMKDSLDNVAHDLRTPLTRLRAVSEEALESDRDIEKYQEALVTCLEESQQAITMLKALMD